PNKENREEDNNNYINRPRLIEGRLPENSGECVVEEGNIATSGVVIGSKLKIKSGSEVDINNTLETDEYTVVGIVNSPNYLSFEKGNSNIGNGKVSTYIMILDEDIKGDEYSEVYVTAKGTKELNSFNEKYEENILETKNSLKSISEGSLQKRYSNILAKANATININEINSEELQVNNYKKPEWYILDRNANYSFVDYGGSADKISAIAKVFPIFFFLVAALVCLTTMTRMVDEQRVNTGTLKALGYSKFAIASKYILYAGLASGTGSILGIIIGFTLFPSIIFNAYSIMYTLPPVVLQFNMFYAFIATFAAVSITTLSAYLACNKELIEMPALLMRPKSPKEGKRILIERIPFIWNKLNFSKKVTARNIFRYKKRFFMTVIGIAGCTALLLAGFGIKDSIQAIISKQFGEVYKYNMSINFENKTSILDQEGILNNTFTNGEIEAYTNIKTKNTEISTSEAKESVSVIVPNDLENFDNFIELKNRKSKEKLSIEDNGIILSEKA
ncbi:MAG: ABC transporter permease, partial [Clostridium sp.]